MHYRLGFFGFPTIQAAFASIPAGVSSLDLGWNYLHNKTAAELVEILGAIPEHVNTIRWEGGVIQRPRVQQLVRNVEDCLLSTKGVPNFEALPMPEEIDEALLSSYITLLEKKASPIALFTAGLLLEGRIANHCDQEEKANCLAYCEKRDHDAITFYLKAAEADNRLKPLINFILWEMRTTTEIPSIAERLFCLTIESPREFISTIDNYEAATSTVKTVALNSRYGFFLRSINKDNKEQRSSQDASCNAGYKGPDEASLPKKRALGQ